MNSTASFDLVGRKYREAFGASAPPGYAEWMTSGGGVAALGYRRADSELLFLEAYLDEPVEVLASRALGRDVPRHAIVEIGNLASDNALAMIGLWGRAANDLGSISEVAVATLTAPLRHMFRRIGLTVIAIAEANPRRLGRDARQWGSYYAQDPQVCVGEIAVGQAAIAALLARRSARNTA